MNVLEPNFVNVVSLGSWNKRLFTPTWVSSNLFNLPAGASIHGLVNAEEYEFVFEHGDLSLFPKENSFEIRLKSINMDAILKSNKLMNQLFGLLPHTPVRGTGFNVGYKISTEHSGRIVDRVRQYLNVQNGLQLGQLRFGQRHNNLTHFLIVDNIRNMNFDLVFNFHYEKTTSISYGSFVDNFQFAQIEIVKK